MKKFYAFFLVAMMCMAIGVNAQTTDWYISGAFQGWSHGNANYKFTETSSGVFKIDLANTPAHEIYGEFLIVQKKSTASDPDWSTKIGTNGQKVVADTPYKYVKGANNFNMDGSVTNAVITLDTNTGYITVAGEAQVNDYDTVYLVGDINGSGWNENLTTYPLHLAEGSETVFTGNIDFTTANSYFKMKAGVNVYGTGGGDVTVALDTDYTASMSGSAYKIGPGSYTVTFTLEKNADTGVLKVTGQAEENEYDVVYLVGDFGSGWSLENTDYPLTLAEGSETTWTAEYTLANTTYFKMLAGHNVYGTGSGNVDVEMGTKYTASQSGEAFKLTPGKYVFTFELPYNGATGDLTVTAGVVETDLEFGVVGSMNDWDFENPLTMTKENNVYTYTFESLPAGASFKIGIVGEDGASAFGAENNAVGGGDVDVILNKAMNAWKSSSNNWVIAEALTDVTITFTYASSNVGTVTVSGTVKEEALYVYYFQNSDNWEEVSAYAWNNPGDDVDYLGAWPGTPAVKLSDELYVITSTKKLVNLIFNNNNNGSQTPDMTPVNNGCYDPTGAKVETPANPLAALAVPTVEGDVELNYLTISGKVSDEVENFTVTFNFPIEGMVIEYQVVPDAVAALEEAPARAAEGWETATAADPSVTIALGSGKLTAKAVLAEGVESEPVTYTYEVTNNTTGVSNVEVEAAEAVYYNLQGVRVANPANGVFIRVTADKAVKVAL